MLRSMMVLGALFLVACGDDTGGAGGAGTGGDGSGGSTSAGDGGGDSTTSAGGGTTGSTTTSTGTTGSASTTGSTGTTTGGGGESVIAACEEYKVFAEGLADDLACGVQELDCADPANGFDACPDVWEAYFDCSRENTDPASCVCDEDDLVSCDNPAECEEEFNALLECLSA